MGWRRCAAVCISATRRPPGRYLHYCPHCSSAPSFALSHSTPPCAPPAAALPRSNDPMPATGIRRSARNAATHSRVSRGNSTAAGAPVRRSLIRATRWPTLVLVALLGSNAVSSGASVIAVCPTPRSAPPGPALWIPDITAALGASAAFTVQLASGGSLIAGLQTDVAFPPTAPVAVQANGKPDCAVNPNINKNATTFVFRLDGCAGAACSAVRAQVLSLLDVDPIPDGSPLFTCTVTIPPAASAPLAFTLANTILASSSGVQ